MTRLRKSLTNFVNQIIHWTVQFVRLFFGFSIVENEIFFLTYFSTKLMILDIFFGFIFNSKDSIRSTYIKRNPVKEI